MIAPRLLRRARTRVTCTTLLLLLATTTASTAVIEVKSGESIQAAIDGASPGDTVQVAAGTYSESIVIRTDNLSVVSKPELSGERAILDGEGAQLELVRIEADDVVVSGFELRHAMGSGVVVYKSSGAAVESLVIENTGAIGINIAESESINVTTCAMAGHSSAGLSISRSTGVFVRDCVSFDNLTGIRIQNSSHFRLTSNTVFRNSTGIALLTVPDRSETASERGHVFYNRIFDNNRPTTADPGTVDAAMIPGTGLYVAGADHVEVAHNRFERNNTYAAITVSLRNAGLPGSDDEDAHQTTDHLYVHHNRYAGNGAEASPEFSERFPDQPAGDLYWDETGERNQWQESGEFRTVPEKLVQQQGGAHTNVIHFI